MEMNGDDTEMLQVHSQLACYLSFILLLACWKHFHVS
jgi:hypothetical protein